MSEHDHDHGPPESEGATDEEKYGKGFPYRWTARLKDGSVLCQFDEKGTQHRFDELWEKKEEIDFLQVTGLERPVVVSFPDGADPIIFERVRRTTDGVNGFEERFSYFGFKHIVEGRSQKVFLVVHHRSGLLAVEYDDVRTRA